MERGYRHDITKKKKRFLDSFSNLTGMFSPDDVRIISVLLKYTDKKPRPWVCSLAASPDGGMETLLMLLNITPTDDPHIKIIYFTRYEKSLKIEPIEGVKTESN